MIKPTVLVKYLGLQEGFGPMLPKALFNVVGGDVPDLLGSTVTIESLTGYGFVVREQKTKTLSSDNTGRAAGSVEVNGPTNPETEPLASLLHTTPAGCNAGSGPLSTPDSL